MRCDWQFNNFLVIEDETSVSLIVVLFYTQSADCKNSEATLVVTKQGFIRYRCNNFNIYTIILLTVSVSLSLCVAYLGSLQTEF